MKHPIRHSLVHVYPSCHRNPASLVYGQHQPRAASTITNSRRKRNFYEILGVSADADKKAIKSRFYKLSLEYHPDRNSSDDTAHAKFLEISEAYSVLGNDAKRVEYDRSRIGYRAAQGTTTGTGSSTHTGTGPRRGYTRENINPQDWILHRRSHRNSNASSQSSYNYTAHQEGHYGSASEAREAEREQGKERRRPKNRYYDEMFQQERSQPRFVTVFALVLFGSFFLLHSGSLLFMEAADERPNPMPARSRTRIRRAVEVDSAYYNVPYRLLNI